jgi:hypothetical protein
MKSPFKKLLQKQLVYRNFGIVSTNLKQAMGYIERKGMTSFLSEKTKSDKAREFIARGKFSMEQRYVLL